MNAKLTITRDSGDTIKIKIVDGLSRIKFVELELSPHDFTLALTGLAYTDCECKVMGLAFVGKKKISELRTVKLPDNIRYYSKGKEDWLKENCQEDGWFLDSYLGSQSSITYKDHETYLNYRVYKYVDVETHLREEE